MAIDGGCTSCRSQEGGTSFVLGAGTPRDLTPGSNGKVVLSPDPQQWPQNLLSNFARESLLELLEATPGSNSRVPSSNAYGRCISGRGNSCGHDIAGPRSSIALAPSVLNPRSPRNLVLAEYGDLDPLRAVNAGYELNTRGPAIGTSASGTLPAEPKCAEGKEISVDIEGENSLAAVAIALGASLELMQELVALAEMAGSAQVLTSTYTIAYGYGLGDDMNAAVRMAETKCKVLMSEQAKQSPQVRAYECGRCPGPFDTTRLIPGTAPCNVHCLPIDVDACTIVQRVHGSIAFAVAMFRSGPKKFKVYCTCSYPYDTGLPF